MIRSLLLTVVLTGMFSAGALAADKTKAAVPATTTPLTFTCPNPTPTPVVGQFFSMNCPITGGVPPYVLTITDGVLPPGLSAKLIQIGNAYFMAITGTPTQWVAPPTGAQVLLAKGARPKK